MPFSPYPNRSTFKTKSSQVESTPAKGTPAKGTPAKSAQSKRFDPSPSITGLQAALQHRLSALPYPAYTRLVRRLLMESGYAGVRGMKSALAPHAPQPGGFDLIAFFHTDLATHLTAIQIKQPRQVVGRRYVDELRGAMLRLGAEQGLIVVTGEFSQAAREAPSLPTFLPIRLLGGLDLAARLLDRGEGVCIKRLPTRPGETVEWEVDQGFFARLEAPPSGSATGKPATGKIAPGKPVANQPLTRPR